MRVTNPYSENEIPDQSIRMLAKKIKSAIREKLRLDPDNIVIEGYYKSGLSKSLPIGIHFPIPKGTEWPWTSIKEELFKSINEILEDSGLGKHIDDPDVLRGQYRLSLSKASPKEGSVLIEVWPREIEKIRMNPRKAKIKKNPDLDSLRSYLNKIGGSEEDFLNIVASNYKLDDDDVETLEDIPIDIIEEALPSYVEAIKGTKVSKNPGAHFKDDDFRVDTWFERDRAYVGLVNTKTEETVVEWWDDQVHEAIQDGFLDPRDYKKSALEYAKSMKLIWGENRPVKNPKKILKAHKQRISLKIKKLMKEGMKQKQAVATALSMQRAGRLGPRGGYRKNPVGGVSHSSISKIARGYNGKIHFVEQDIMIFSFEDMSLADGFIGEVSAIPTVQTYKDSIGGAALVLVFLKNHGQFQKNPIKNELMAEALAALAGLLKYPERSEDVREEVLAALEAEGYWNVDRGVTEKGRKFLEEICSLEDLPE